MILGGINNEKKPIGEVSEIAELRKELDELKKTVETLKYGLILFALFYLYDKFKK
jgi:hypothetical protein